MEANNKHPRWVYLAATVIGLLGSVAAAVDTRALNGEFPYREPQWVWRENLDWLDLLFAFVVTWCVGYAAARIVRAVVLAIRPKPTGVEPNPDPAFYVRQGELFDEPAPAPTKTRRDWGWVVAIAFGAIGLFAGGAALAISLQNRDDSAQVVSQQAPAATARPTATPTKSDLWAGWVRDGVSWLEANYNTWEIFEDSRFSAMYLHVGIELRTMCDWWDGLKVDLDEVALGLEAMVNDGVETLDEAVRFYAIAEYYNQAPLRLSACENWRHG